MEDVNKQENGEPVNKELEEKVTNYLQIKAKADRPIK
jgi:hypothetical protein